MAESASTKLSKDKNAKQAERKLHGLARQKAPRGPQAHILGFQRTVGNLAVSQLLQARNTSPEPVNAERQDVHAADNVRLAQAIG